MPVIMWKASPKPRTATVFSSCLTATSLKDNYDLYRNSGIIRNRDSTAVLFCHFTGNRRETLIAAGQDKAYIPQAYSFCLRLCEYGFLFGDI